MDLIRSEEYGIDKKQAEELIGNLPQIKEERSSLESQYNEIIKLDIDNEETVTRARDLRLLIQKNRTKGINVWHKTTKDFFLKGGQFVDAIKRKEIAVNERMESDLEAIEKHAEIQERKKTMAIQSERESVISAYMDDAHERNLGEMDEDVWAAYFSAKKKDYEDLMQTLKKAEEERLKREAEEKIERERLAKENEKLKNEAIKRERLAKIEEKKRVDAANERFLREKKEREERELIEVGLKKERDRLADQLKVKEEAERLTKETEEARIQSELNKGDSEKVKDLINQFENIKSVKFKSRKNKKMMVDVCLLIDKVISHIKK